VAQQYTKPPLIEAVFEFRFTQTPDWDLSIPGSLYQKIQSRFPIKESVNEAQVEFELDPQKSPQPKISHSQSELVRFWDQEKTTFVVSKRNVISIHCVKDYGTWDPFFEKIKFLFEQYQQIPTELRIERLGLRYINKFSFNKEGFKLSDKFIFKPDTSGLDFLQEEGISAIQCGVISRDGDNFIKIQLNSVHAPENKIDFLLDTDYFKEGRIAADTVNDWLVAAHTKIEETFNKALQPSTFESFN
jgi:uncharacterized protein (TIGR04255 family)